MWCCLLKRNNRTMQCDTKRSRMEQTRKGSVPLGTITHPLTLTGPWKIIA